MADVSSEKLTGARATTLACCSMIPPKTGQNRENVCPPGHTRLSARLAELPGDLSVNPGTNLEASAGSMA